VLSEEEKKQFKKESRAKARVGASQETVRRKHCVANYMYGISD
jgi:hypothetical protein